VDLDHLTRSARDPRVGILRALGLLFLARVCVQLVQRIGEVSWLPPFDAWQSGALPYPVLVAAQVAILIAMVVIISRAARGQVTLRGAALRVVFVFGVVYLLLMSVRLMAGLTVAEDGSWFDNPLPSLFHLVLATFVLSWVSIDRARSR
jgi:hypothetical protein